MRVQTIHQNLSFVVHLEEHISSFNKELFSVLYAGVDIVLVLGNYLTCQVINHEFLLFSKSSQVRFIELAVFDAARILHCDGGESQVLIEDWNLLKLSLFINVEHDLGLHLHQGIRIMFKRLIWVIVALFSMDVHMVLFVQLPIYVFLDRAVVVIEVLVAVVELQIIITLFRHYLSYILNGLCTHHQILLK